MSTHVRAAGTTAAAAPRPGTLLHWITRTHHVTIGRRLIVTGLGFFGLAGLAALLMRLQLVAPQGGLLGPEAYQQLLSEHGSTMLMLFAVPVMEGFALLVVPAMLGADDAAYPRLASFGYWLYALSASAAWIALAFGQAPDAGWFNYVPLATPRYQPGVHSDVYAATVLLSQAAIIVLAVVLVSTILTRRAPGMRLRIMPLPAWAALVASVMVLMATPPLLVDVTLLTADARLGTHMFSASSGGDPLLWQHLFWFFGHPLVYFMLLPGLGIISVLTATFARRPMVGYPFIVSSYLGIGFLSFGVWVHHMFATGHADSGTTLFSMATFAVAVPSGVHVFAVLATLWHGKVRLEVPMLYVLGFIVVFVAGGITGVTLGSMTADRQYTDTYYVVAHFHYVLLGGVLLPILGGLHYWWGKLTGWLPPRRPGYVAFALIFTGIHVTFLPQFAVGLLGMPRRVYSYAPGHGWEPLNLASTVGAFLLGLGLLVYAGGLLRSIGRVPAPQNPWGAGTLDVTDRVPAQVTSRYPLWAQREEVEAGPRRTVPERPATVLPPVAAALLTFAILGIVFDPWLTVIGLVLAAVAVVGWLLTPFGPRSERVHVGMAVGMIPVVVGTLCLVSTWWFLAAESSQWPIPPASAHTLWTPLVQALLLGGATFAALAAVRRQAAGRAVRPLLLVVAGAAAAFVLVQVLQLWLEDYDQANNATTSAEWLVAGGFALVVAVLALQAGVVAAVGRAAARPDAVRAVAMLAGVLAASWPLVAFTVDVGARLT